MLVLSRFRDEVITIGNDIEVTVVDIRGDKVRLGVNAPRHIQVHRKEVYEAIKRENQSEDTKGQEPLDSVLVNWTKKKPVGLCAVLTKELLANNEFPIIRCFMDDGWDREDEETDYEGAIYFPIPDRELL